jgi:hypothetical protein
MGHGSPISSTTDLPCLHLICISSMCHCRCVSGYGVGDLALRVGELLGFGLGLGRADLRG